MSSMIFLFWPTSSISSSLVAEVDIKTRANPRSCRNKTSSMNKYSAEISLSSPFKDVTTVTPNPPDAKAFPFDRITRNIRHLRRFVVVVVDTVDERRNGSSNMHTIGRSWNTDSSSSLLLMVALFVANFLPSSILIFALVLVLRESNILSLASYSVINFEGSSEVGFPSLLYISELIINTSNLDYQIDNDVVY